MSFKKTQEACRRLAEMSTPKLLTTDMLFEYLDQYIKELREAKGESVIPHMVLSHGFMQWGSLLGSQFPCLLWRSKDTESLDFDTHERFFYDRFFLRIAELPSLKDMAEEEKNKLKEDGWRTYLED